MDRAGLFARCQGPCGLPRRLCGEVFADPELT